LTNRAARRLRRRFDTPHAARYDGPEMNRLKLWLFVALVLGVGLGSLYYGSRWLSERAVAQVDRELRSGSGQVDARLQLLAAEAARLAEALSRDPALVQALAPEGEGDPAAAAEAALQAAGRGAGEAGRGVLVLTSGRGGRTLRVDGGAAALDRQVEALLPEAGARREAPVAIAGGLFYAVGVPAGRGAVAVGLALHGAWLQALRAGTGCEATLVLDGKPLRSTLPPGEAQAVAAAARGPAGRPASAGALGPQPNTAGLPVPALPLLFGEAPAHRVEPVALKGLANGVLALSQATAPLLAPLVTWQWLGLAALAFLLLAGLVLGLLVTNEQRTVVPSELVAVADRVRRGDFTARAPVLAGSLGTVAAALNRAVEAASGTAAAAVAPDAASAPADPFAAPAAADPFASAPADPFVGAPSASADASPAAPPPAPPEPSPAAEPAAAAAPFAAAEPPPAAEPFAAGEPAAPSAHAAGDGGAGEPKPEPFTLRPAPEGGALPDTTAPWPPSDERRADAGSADAAFAAFASPREPSRAAEREETTGTGTGTGAFAPVAPGGAAAEHPEEEHWRSVYDDFLRVRGECGEPPDGVPYDRFRQKLQKNHDALMQKYGCRTVRFQVYVKEGKAALKASPVR
jgi:hypothetical protein